MVLRQMTEVSGCCRRFTAHKAVNASLESNLQALNQGIRENMYNCCLISVEFN